MHNQQNFIVHPVDSSGQQAKIKVLGVGGGGGNAVDHMVSSKIEGVEFFRCKYRCPGVDARQSYQQDSIWH